MSTLAPGTVRVGVAGAGVFGRNHALKLAADTGARLTGIFDIDLARAQRLGQEFDVPGFSGLEDFLAGCDAVVVATPAVFHSGVAAAALKAGKHCLVEKPLAATEAEALALCALADAGGLVLQAGHQERYVFKAMGLIPATRRPDVIEAVRAGPPSPRGSDVSVTLDLMVHDLDLAALLMGAQPVSVSARLLAGPPEKPDAVTATLDYADGAVVRLTASRAASERDRRMNLTYPNGEVAIDFIAKRFEDHAGLGLHADFASRIPDPMGAATADFLAAVRGERAVAVSGHDGAAAVALAARIDAACAR